MGKIRFERKFVTTPNVRDFLVMMDNLELSEGEGRLGMAFGQAGWGKSRTAGWYHSNHTDSIFLRMQQVWRKSELGFLKSLLIELGNPEPKNRTVTCFNEIVDKLIENPVPIFLDEVDRLPDFFLDVIRDITDMTTAPIILIGEENLPHQLRSNRRVWSRVFHQLKFKPLELADIINYAQETTGLKFTPGVAKILYQATDGKSLPGNFRVVQRALISLVHMLNSENSKEVTEKIARIAIKTGLSGR
jgi:DNA transposition AAA+ family ATPase